MKRATLSIIAIDDGIVISIHALVKRATEGAKFALSTFAISIHALVKRATSFVPAEHLLVRHFNPRPREEGDPTFFIIPCRGCKISIHALVKRATQRRVRPLLQSDISIHALVKRATTDGTGSSHSNTISIHALVKRATSFHCLYYNAPLYFNPRPREEGDYLDISIKDY